MQLIKTVEKTAIKWKNASISYPELLSHISSLAIILSELSAKRVAIISENRPEWIYALYASWYSKAQVVPIDHLSSSDEIVFILKDCQPDVIFCSAAYCSKINELLSHLTFPVKAIVLEECKSKDPKAIFQSNWEPDFQDTALIIYTSGTTGSPKGVMLSFGNIWANISGVSEKIPIFQQQERVLIMLPLHHTFPLLGSLVAPLAVGATVAIAPSLSSDDILETIQINKISIIIGVPRFYNLIRKGIKDKINKRLLARVIFSIAGVIKSKNFSKRVFSEVHEKFGGQLKYLVCGGAAIDIEVARDFQTLGFEMLEGYGMTEAAPMITFTRPNRRKLGSAGEALPGTELIIENGEILARGKNIMQAYYKLPEETSEVLKDGWLHTGDMGYLDPDGFLFITGRLKEIIVLSNGKNVNPIELEKALSSGCPYISDIGVYAQNDQLHAVIFPDFAKLKQDSVHHIENYFREFLDRFNLSVSSHKRIIRITLVKSELPKTRLGKIQRFMLADLAGQESRKLSSIAEPDDPVYPIIKDFLSKMCDCQVHPDDHLEIDLGIDSLDKVNLLTYLQNSFGISSGDSLFSECPTVRELSDYCHKKKSRVSSENVDWKSIFRESHSISLPKSGFSHQIIQYLLKFVFTLYFSLKGQGQSNIPNIPCIITPNHQSFLDGFYITSLLKSEQLKKTLFFAKEKHVSKNWQKVLASRHNIIIMDINRDLKYSLQKMASALINGKNIVIFPEGTRTKNGQMGRFKRFYAILSKELNVPIVPVVISGAFDALPTGKRIPRFRQKITISFLKPIFPEHHSLESLQERVQQTMLKNEVIKDQTFL